MKRQNSKPDRRRGIALVIVLAFLFLITALVIAFFSSVTTELSGAKGYASEANAKQLANTATQTVMGIIRVATSGTDGNGNTLAWASQPGMIRTYNTSGNSSTYYKLYSSGTLAVTSFPFDPSTDLNPNWNQQSALYTDLNSPVISGTTLLFPIVDGNNLVAGNTLNPPITSSTGGPCLTYCSNANKVPDVEGFYVQTPATYNSSAPISGTNNPIPMPAQWIYVLRDGSLVSPTGVDSTGNVASFPAGTTGSAGQNPIVGRIAFWTDDETCKLNVNTAGEGNFSDTPKAQGVSDFDIAYYPPTQNEYQRYPGHPSMTCLSSVLGSLFPVNHTLDAAVSGYTPSSAPTYGAYEPYFDMNPRLNIDQTGNLGSQAGTAKVTGTEVLSTRSDRLYASVDEFLFQPTRLANPPNTTGTLNSNTIEEAKFFLTSSSRAPDVNLFNQPRIVTWPICATSGSAYQTIFDQAIAFCGQIGTSGSYPYEYYFQRQRNDHPTADLPVTSSTTGIGRNRMLIQYLENLTSQNIPGFGGNFVTKYPPPERDQILTEIFDFIRCLNLNDQSSPTMTHPFAPVASSTNGYGSTWGSPTYAGAGPATASTTYAGSGAVVPIYDSFTKTKGFGRFPTISEVSLIFIATGWNDGNGGSVNDVNYYSLSPTTKYVGTSGSAPWGYYCSGTTPNVSTTPPSPQFLNPGGGYVPAISGSNIQVQAALLLNFFDPSQGYVSSNGTYSIHVIGLGNMQWGPTVSGTLTSMGFPTATSGTCPDYTSMAASNVTDQNVSTQYTVSWGGNLGFRRFFQNMRPGQVWSSQFYYPYFSAASNFPYSPSTPNNPGTFYFNGGQITINFLLPTNTPGWPLASGSWPLTDSELPTRPPIQQITVSFPPATLPLPTYAPPAANNIVLGGAEQDRGSFYNRFEYATYNWGSNALFICGPKSTAPGAPGTDTVRSVRAYPGDIRMIAGVLSATDSAINPAPSPGYFDSSETKIYNSGLTAWNYGTASTSSGVHLVHSLRESVDYPFYGAILGDLVPGVAYSNSRIPFPTNGAPNAPDNLGDFSGAGNNATTAGAFIGGGTNGLFGDWDNGFGYTADGPYINKPDEGNFSYTSGVPYFGASNYGAVSAGQTYFSPNRLMPSPVQFGSLPTGVARNIPWQTLLFCPDPAAIANQSPGNVHPGFGVPVNNATTGLPPYLAPYQVPPDHLLLDLFNMPVVEPYPITEPLSTAGRINMNYQIAPYTYIERSTGMRAVLKSERMTVIPNGAAGVYKAGGGTSFSLSSSNGTYYDYRVPINPDQTLAAFDYYFSNNKDIFRSASQICDMFLYPARDAILSSTSGPLWDNQNANITAFWKTHQITGDNSRERPYATIYPRLTTKSNTFTIHMRVQTLKKTTDTSANSWDNTKDVVTSEYRGSQTIERYADPSDTTIPDFANPNNYKYELGAYPNPSPNPNNPGSLMSAYKFRVISTKKFTP